MKFYILLSLTVFLFGASVFFRKLAVDIIHPYQIQIIASLIYVLTTPLWIYYLSKEPVSWSNTTGLIYASICLVMYIVAVVLFSFLLKSSSEPGMVATLVALNPVITSILTFIFLKEDFGIRKVIATIIMIFGFYLFNKGK